MFMYVPVGTYVLYGTRVSTENHVGIHTKDHLEKQDIEDTSANKTVSMKVNMPCVSW
jgi:hypothetical protein